MRHSKKIVDAVMEIDEFRKLHNVDFQTAYASFLSRIRLHPYQKLQVAYICMMYLYCFEDIDKNIIYSVLRMWQMRIASIGLFDSVPIPDDRKMNKTLSRLSRTDSRLWEEQGHRHRTDGMTLLERIYMVYEQIT